MTTATTTTPTDAGIRQKDARTRPAGGIRRPATAVRRRRPAARPRRNILLTIVMALFVVYSFVPLAWLLINATKTQGDLFTTFGLGFGPHSALFQNIV